MKIFEVHWWNFARDGLLTFEKVKELFQPPRRYMIREKKYPAGGNFHGLGRAGTVYVLSGDVTFMYESIDREIEILAGQFARLPEGGYEVRVGYREPVLFVHVWELPPAFWEV